MIRIHMNEPSYPDWPTPNPYVEALDAWKAWGKALGLTYVPSGSERLTLDPGEWCVQSYNRGSGHKFQGRNVCFNEENRLQAIIFMLVWGGK